LWLRARRKSWPRVSPRRKRELEGGKEGGREGGRVRLFFQYFEMERLDVTAVVVEGEEEELAQGVA